MSSVTINQKRGNFITNLPKRDWFNTLITSLACALIGLLVGFLVLLVINPIHAVDGIVETIKNFLVFSKTTTKLKYFGQTIAKSAPLIMTGLSIAFAYKAGLFNIGASGQYMMGILVTCYAALAWGLPWYICIILAMIAGAIYGSITGFLKAYFNVNEVISGIMLNWIGLYIVNAFMQKNSKVWNATISTTYQIKSNTPSFLPTLGLDKIFGGNEMMGVGIILAIVMAIIIFIILNKTTFGYEIKATGLNRFAAQYCGMKQKQNVVLILAISGALSGMGASFIYLNGFARWTLSSVVDPMGFNGLSAAFLGGLSPIGIIFSSYFIMHITDGGSMITDFGYSPETAKVVTAFIIYLCAFVAFVKEMIIRRMEKRSAVINKNDKNITPPIPPTPPKKKNEKVQTNNNVDVSDATNDVNVNNGIEDYIDPNHDDGKAELNKKKPLSKKSR